MSVLGWSGLTAATTAGALLVPLAPVIGEDLRVATCRSTGGSCGYVPATLRCAVLARDSGVASGLTPLSEVTSADGSITTTKFLDGGAEVFVRDRRSARWARLAERRLASSGSAGGPGSAGAAVVGAVWSFPRHDDADAWRDRYLLAAAPVTAAAAGPGGAGVHLGVDAVVRSVGFDDPDRVREPDGVVIEVGAQATDGAGYLGVSAGNPKDAGTRSAAKLTGGPGATTLTVDATGRATTSGPLPLAPTARRAGQSLATRLGFGPDEPPTYLVRTDAAGRPTTLVLTGTAARTADGSLLASTELTRIREQGESLGAANSADADREQGIRTRQTVLLDLRGPTNQRAFAQVFRAGRRLSVPTPAGTAPVAGTAPAAGRATGGSRLTADRKSQQAVAALVRRIGQDAVFVRTRVRGAADPVVPVGPAGGRRTESLMLQGFSQDFAVPASRLTRMPGCSR
jgi:hypothetical protein